MCLNIKGSEAIKEYNRKAKILAGRKELTIELNKALLEVNDYTAIVKSLPEQSLQRLHRLIKPETLDLFLTLFAETLTGRKDIIITKRMREVIPSFNARNYDSINTAVRNEFSKHLPEGFIDIEGFPNYAINKNGFLITKKDRLPKKVLINEKGYVVTTMKGIDKGYLKKLHLLVYKTFNGNTDLTIDHKDGNKTNYKLDNLEACTITENRERAKRNGLMVKGEEVNTNILTTEQVIEIAKDKTLSNMELAIKYGVSYSAISGIKKGRNWSNLTKNIDMVIVKKDFVNTGKKMLDIEVYDRSNDTIIPIKGLIQLKHYCGAYASDSRHLFAILRKGWYKDRYSWRIAGDKTDFEDIVKDNAEQVYDVIEENGTCKRFYSYVNLFKTYISESESKTLNRKNKSHTLNTIRRLRPKMKVIVIK